MTKKVKVVLEFPLDLPITAEEAVVMYPDTEWPIEALALDYISDDDIREMIQDVNLYDVVIDVVDIYD